MITKFVTDYIDKKLKENDEFIRYSFYELKIKNNLSEKEIEEFLRINKDYFENKKYRVYFTGEKFKYHDVERIVEPNELMVAIKD